MFSPIWKTLFASALLLTLAVSARAAEPAAKGEQMGDADKKPMATGSEETRRVQQALKAKNYDPGPIDGRMGPKTQGALKDFQQASGLKATGQLDSQTAEKLGVAKTTAATKPEKMETKSKEPASTEKK